MQRRTFLMATSAALAGCGASEASTSEQNAQQARAASVTYAHDFGIYPDNALDQTGKIQAAINACSGLLDFQQPGYYLHTGLTGKSGLVLDSSSRGAILKNPAL